jgi:hypothetical protein
MFGFIYFSFNENITLLYFNFCKEPKRLLLFDVYNYILEMFQEKGGTSVSKYELESRNYIDVPQKTV